ncbi:MAG TPA: PilT/PilU family type 4a pilus ATPase [Firmicutes bacterium]|nr:PilT/PilU family type 4a pilus ATPase [Bacillota bacterium]
MKKLELLLEKALQENASDLHLVSGKRPFLRIGRELYPMKEEPLEAKEIQDIAFSIMNHHQKEKFDEELNLSFSMYFIGLGRFRISVYKAKGNIEMAIRVVGERIKSIEELRLPKYIEEVAHYSTGLVLVTGPTGAGKTTTLNVIIDIINSYRSAKILTIEDPVEFYHDHKKSIIVQKEVLLDTPSFDKALYHALREDPDVIVIGELRDLETIKTALIAAETGHLVFATLHTTDTTQTVQRIVDVFPPFQQNQVRVQLALTLRGVISQRLLPQIEEKKQVLVYEILKNNNAVKNCIRENKIQSIFNVIQTNYNEGMILMDSVIKDLYTEGMISYDVAISNLTNPKAIRDR